MSAPFEGKTSGKWDVEIKCEPEYNFGDSPLVSPLAYPPPEGFAPLLPYDLRFWTVLSFPVTCVAGESIYFDPFNPSVALQLRAVLPILGCGNDPK